MSFDTNATHVVQKIIGMLKEESRDTINKILLGSIRELVLDQNGICVVRIIMILDKETRGWEHGLESQKGDPSQTDGKLHRSDTESFW